MYQIYVDRDKLEIKITKIKNTFRGTKEEGEAWRNPTKIVSYYIYYSFCANRDLLIEYANTIKEKWLSDAYENVKRIEQIKF